MRQRDVFVSPDGQRYVVLLVRGDLERNGNSMEVISGRLSSLDAARNFEIVARLFTRSLGSSLGYGSSSLTLPGFNTIAWLDNERIAFLWEREGVPQVVAVDVETYDVEYLTNHPPGVERFDVSARGTLIYTARAEHSRAASEELIRKGFSVVNRDVFSLLAGDADGYSTYDRVLSTERFVSDPPPQRVRKIKLNGRSVTASHAWQPACFSPNGRLALIDGTPAHIADTWRKYTHRRFVQELDEARENASYLGARAVWQLFILDIDKAMARPLWNAPMWPGLRAAWSPDGNSVLLGPTFLPVALADEAGLAGNAVAEVDVATGRFRILPIPSHITSRGINTLLWLDVKTIKVVDAEESGLLFEKRRGTWNFVAQNGDANTDEVSAPIRVEFRQDLNTPPVLFAVEASSGREEVILDPNPRLRADFTLGRVERIRWLDKKAKEWSGRFYYPVDYTPDRRFPMVVQVSRRLPDTMFSLSGSDPGLGTGHAVYAAQPLVNRGIALLQIDELRGSDSFGTAGEAEVYMGAYDAAVDHFVSVGIADSEKIGLIGFSRFGWYVEYTLTRSEFPYAAAVVADNVDAGYLQASMAGWPKEFDSMNGVGPFGDGLREWLERAPPFNAHKVRGALQLQVHSGGLVGVANAWEMFSRLRQLTKPVELYVVPEIDRGSHGLQNPAQSLAAQSRAVDWFHFWLNGREDPDPTKADQYAAWRVLLHQQRTLLQTESTRAK